LTKPIRYSLIIFVAGLIVFSIMQGLTSNDESFVVLDKDYMNQLDTDITIKRFGGLVLILCCLTATTLTGYSLTKEKGNINCIIFFIWSTITNINFNNLYFLFGFDFIFLLTKNMLQHWQTNNSANKQGLRRARSDNGNEKIFAPIGKIPNTMVGLIGGLFFVVLAGTFP
jgi:hypothetical protein